MTLKHPYRVSSPVSYGYIAKPYIVPDVVEFDPIQAGLNLYPTYCRSLILDILLQKWGTCDESHKLVYSLNPINQQGYPIEKTYFLTDHTLHNELKGLAILDVNGYSKLANTNPDDSYVLVGKYATHRYKTTKLVDIFTEFVNVPVSTKVQVERTLTGEDVYDVTESGNLTDIQNRTDLNLGGKWFNILVRGRMFNLKRILVRGYQYGR